MSERDFQNELTRIAPLYKCEIITIPDFIPIKNNKIIAHKRPFDCVLVTPKQNYLIECKYQNNTLLPHQKSTQAKVNAINGSYYAIRKKALKKGVFYSIEQGKLKFTTNDITKIFAFFNDPREYYSQKLMMDSILPEKKKPRMRKVLL